MSEPRRAVGNSAWCSSISTKGQREKKIFHLYLAAFMLPTRTVRSYPFSAGRWVSEKFLSFVFLIKHMPDKKP